MSDSSARFTNRTRDYASARPSYPAGAIDAILSGLGNPASIRAADVGAGTGISARLLADRGVQVVAVEPNAAMRDAATLHSRVTWTDGTADATGLEADSVDLIVCAQAYHWFAPETAGPEFVRILKPGGRLALMWNEAKLDSSLARGYYEALARVAVDDTRDRRVAIATQPRVEPWFERPQTHTFANAQLLTQDGLVTRAMSASYAPKIGADAEWLRDRLRRLHAAHCDADGVAALEYDVLLHLTVPT